MLGDPYGDHATRRAAAPPPRPAGLSTLADAGGAPSIATCSSSPIGVRGVFGATGRGRREHGRERGQVTARLDEIADWGGDYRFGGKTWGKRGASRVAFDCRIQRTLKRRRRRVVDHTLVVTRIPGLGGLKTHCSSARRAAWSCGPPPQWTPPSAVWWPSAECEEVTCRRPGRRDYGWSRSGLGSG